MKRGRLELDPDILVRIFDLLPIRSLVACSLVCRSWNQHVKSIWAHSCKKRIGESPKDPELHQLGDLVALEQRRFLCGSPYSVSSWRAHSARVNCLRWTMDTLATGSGDGRIRLWSLPSRSCTEEYSAPKSSRIVELAIDESKVIGAAGAFVHVWKRRKDRPFKTFGGHSRRLQSMCYLDPEVVTGCVDGVVRLYDLYSGSCSLVLRQHHDCVTCISTSPGLHRLATGSYDGTVQFTDPTSGQRTSKYRLLGGVSCLQLLDNGMKMIAGTSSGDAYCWDLRMEKRQPLWQLHVASNINCLHSREYAPSVVGFGGNDGNLYLGDTSTGRFLRTCKADPALWALSIQVGQTRAFTSHADGTVRLWKFRSSYEV